jgi:hypothetical protein
LVLTDGNAGPRTICGFTRRRRQSRLRAFRLRNGQFRQIIEDHVIGELVRDAGLLVSVLARCADGNPDRSADVTLKELRAADR